jgi:excisionase family DNA binding protein
VSNELHLADLESLPARLSINQAATAFGLCDKTIRRWLSEGRIKGYRLGKRTIRIDRDSLLAVQRPIGNAMTTVEKIHVPVYLVAHHEAGHAVAAVMRGGGELVSITIEPTDEYAGHTQTRLKPWSDDAAFVTYAGPWAEARFQWPLPTLHGDDDDGCTFEDYIIAAFLNNIDGDGKQYRDDLDRERQGYGKHYDRLVNVARREQFWSTRELEGVWPVMQSVAALLLAGDTVDHDVVDGLLDLHWGAA